MPDIKQFLDQSDALGCYLFLRPNHIPGCNLSPYLTLKHPETILNPHIPITGDMIAALADFDVVDFWRPLARFIAIGQILCPIEIPAVTAFVISTNHLVIFDTFRHFSIPLFVISLMRLLILCWNSTPNALIAT